MPQVCLQFVIVVFPDHTHLLFLVCIVELIYQILGRKLLDDPTRVGLYH